MPAVTSTMLPLGTIAPDFRLPDSVTGKTVSLSDFKDAPALLVMFICNHCPFVKHIQAGLTQLGKDFQARGVGVAAINSNDAERYPQDGPQQMGAEAKRAGYIFPYLYDATQGMAKAYRAACTPEFYLFDKDRHLVYRGQMDDARRGNTLPVTGKDLRVALEAVLAERPVSPDQKASIGCNIKWIPGNEPDYFQ